jgi:hypothetical protein
MTLAAIAPVAPLYLASALLITPFQPGDGAPHAGVLDLGVRQLGQVLLSGLWAIVGLATLVLGLRRDERVLRLGSLALLLVTVAKVFLYDLAALRSCTGWGRSSRSGCCCSSRPASGSGCALVRCPIFGPTPPALR